MPFLFLKKRIRGPILLHLNVVTQQQKYPCYVIFSAFIIRIQCTTFTGTYVNCSRHGNYVTDMLTSHGQSRHEISSLLTLHILFPSSRTMFHLLQKKMKLVDTKTHLKISKHALLLKWVYLILQQTSTKRNRQDLLNWTGSSNTSGSVTVRVLKNSFIHIKHTCIGNCSQCSLPGYGTEYSGVWVRTFPRRIHPEGWGTWC
jgi:hypothetical protein